MVCAVSLTGVIAAAFLVVLALTSVSTAAPIRNLPTTAMIMANQPNCFGLGFREMGGGDGCGTGRVGGPVDFDG